MHSSFIMGCLIDYLERETLQIAIRGSRVSRLDQICFRLVTETQQWAGEEEGLGESDEAPCFIFFFFLNSHTQ